jgi:hypothetical protein
LPQWRRAKQCQLIQVFIHKCKRRISSDIKDAFKAGMVTNPDGTVTRDDKLTLKALLDIGYGNEAWELQDKMQANQIARQKQDREQQAYKIGEVGRLAGAALQNPNAWMQIRQEAIKSGYGTEESLPQQYDEKFLRGIQTRALTAAEQFAQEQRDRQYQLDKERLEIERGKLKQEKTKEEKNLPQNVYAAATYAKRLEDANNQIGKISKNWDPTSISSSLQGAKLPIPFVDVPLVPERFKSEEKKLMEQAQRNFINAVLRRESGSAIAESEFESANKQYFPQPGDTEAVLEQKQRNREVAIAGLKTEGEKALPRMEGNLASRPNGPLKPQNVAQTKAPVLKGSEIEWK